MSSFSGELRNRIKLIDLICFSFEARDMLGWLGLLAIEFLSGGDQKLGGRAFERCGIGFV